MQNPHMKCSGYEEAPRRRLSAQALLAASVLLLAACGGGSGGSGGGGGTGNGGNQPGPGPDPDPQQPQAAVAPAAQEASSGTFKLMRANASNGTDSAVVSESTHYRLTREEL